MGTDSPARKTPDIRTQRHAALTTDIRRIALRQFSERGYEATSLKDICEEAGVSLRTLFRHFKSKDDILASRAAEWAREIPQELAAIADDVPLIEAYCSALLAVIDEASSDREEVKRTNQLFDEVPSIRGAYLGTVSGHPADDMNIELARRLNISVDDPRVRLLRSFMTVAVVQALSDWAQGDVPGSLEYLVTLYLNPVGTIANHMISDTWNVVES